jgi:hypothetical protein
MYSWLSRTSALSLLRFAFRKINGKIAIPPTCKLASLMMGMLNNLTTGSLTRRGLNFIFVIMREDFNARYNLQKQNPSLMKFLT